MNPRGLAGWGGCCPSLQCNSRRRAAKTQQSPRDAAQGGEKGPLSPPARGKGCPASVGAKADRPRRDRERSAAARRGDRAAPLRSAGRAGPGGLQPGPAARGGAEAGQERCAPLLLTAAAEAFVRALPVCGRGSPGVPLPRQHGLGRQRRGPLPAGPRGSPGSPQRGNCSGARPG